MHELSLFCISSQYLSLQDNNSPFHDHHGEPELQLGQSTNRPSLLNVAAYNGDILKVKYCVEVLHCDPLSFNNLGETTLHVAVEGGQLEILKYLIEDLKCLPITPSLTRSCIHSAAWYGCLPIVKYFIEEKEIDPLLVDIQQKTLLHYACHNGDTALVGYLSKPNNTIKLKQFQVIKLGSEVQCSTLQLLQEVVGLCLF